MVHKNCSGSSERPAVLPGTRASRLREHASVLAALRLGAIRTLKDSVRAGGTPAFPAPQFRIIEIKTWFYSPAGLDISLSDNDSAS